ncbi:hypothetical protein Q7P35_006570 [Cladosporium inversicolor]
MEDSNSHLPPLAPDRDLAQASQSQPKVQPFQEPFVAPSSPLQTPQQSEPRRATTSRSRTGSVSKPILHQPQPQPIRDAVDRAFDQSHPPNTLDPAFIAQVTEAVVKNLQSANLGQRTPATPQAAQYPPPPSVHSVPQSPIISSISSLPPRLTTPSPQRGRDHGGSKRRNSGSPVSVFSDPGNATSKGDRRPNDRDGDTPKPVFGNAEDLSRVEEGRDSVGSIPDASKARAQTTRIPSPLAEVTTLERIWQPLFDNGVPTVRLSQFLRGIALHIIEDYEPKGSLIITPPKMLRFFEQTRIEDELYPWHLIFGGGMVSASISVMFRRLKCEHHLVQTQLHEVPNVPALTPAGFETFLACLIQAHPDLEFERLSHAVRDMPISNADYKTERFPKELSRRLLPAQPNPLAEQCIVASMAHEANLLQLRNSNAMPPPPTSAPPQQSAFPERERKPYSQSTFSPETNDDFADDFVPTVPIERERKPYSAKEGTGKIFAPEFTRDEPFSANYPRPNDPASSRASRPARYDYNFANGGTPDPRAAPPPRKHRSSVGPGMPPTGQTPNTSYAKGRRSPPPTGSYVRSDPVNIGDIPASQYNSNMHGARTQGNFDRDQEASGYHSYRHGSNPPNSGFEDDRSRSTPNWGGQVPQPGGGNDFESPYGSASTGSYPGPRARNYDRRSMYGAPPGMNPGGDSGGSDGWGSYANGNGAPGMYPTQPGYGNAGVQH